MAPSAYRLELFLKDASQVPAVARTLVQQRVQRVNLPNKALHEPVLETVRAVLDAFHEASGGQKLDACPHFSLKVWARVALEVGGVLKPTQGILTKHVFGLAILGIPEALACAVRAGVG